MLLCHTCKVEKSVEEFHAKRQAKRGYSYSCKACTAAYKREYYKTYKTRQKKLLLERFGSSTEGRLAYLITKSKERAKEAGLEHSIELADLTWPDTCPYLGIQLTHELGKGQLPSNASLDRIDPSKGYVPGNVQVISRMANTMKSSASVDQLLTFARSVIKIHGNGGTQQ